MPYTDIALDQARLHRSAAVVPPGVDEFWHEQLARARRTETAPSLEPVAQPLRTVRSLPVTAA